MSRLVKHAEYELSLIKKDSNDEWQAAVESYVMAMVKLFASQGHSGTSAQYAIGIIDKLLNFEPLTALTGEESEWADVDEDLFQNKRCSHVFKEKKSGKSFDIQGRVFRDPDGSTVTNRDSHVVIEFPYVPHIEVVDR